MDVPVSPGASPSRAWLRGACGLLVAGVSLASLASCGTATSLLLVVDSNYRAPDEVNAVRVTVLNADGTPQGGSAEVALSATDDPSLNTHALPFSIGLVPGPAGPDQPVHVRVEAIGPGGVVRVQRDVEAMYQSGRALLLPVFLARECEGYRCGPGLTCTETGCAAPNAVRVTPVQPGEELAVYADARPTPMFDATPEAGPDVPDVGTDVPDAQPDVVVDAPPDALDGGMCPATARPPAKPPTLGDTGDGEPMYAVMHRLRLGLGAGSSENEWRQYGFDLDGLDTYSMTTDIEACRRTSCSGGSMPADGLAGRDNGFIGFVRVVIPQLQLLVPTLFPGTDGGIFDIERAGNDEIAAGTGTVMIRVTGYHGGDDGVVRVDWLPVMAGHVRDVPGSRPAFDGNDEWHVNRTIAYEAGGRDPRITTSDGYVVGGVLVAEFPGSVPLRLSLGNLQPSFRLSNTRLTFTIRDRQLVQGDLGGSWRLSEAVEDLMRSGLCTTLVGTLLPMAVDLPRNPTAVGEEACMAMGLGARLEMVPAVMSATDMDGPGSVDLCAPRDAGPRDSSADAVSDARSDMGVDDAGADATASDAYDDGDATAPPGDGSQDGSYEDAEGGAVDAQMDSDATAPFDAPG